MQNRHKQLFASDKVTIGNFNDNKELVIDLTEDQTKKGEEEKEHCSFEERFVNSLIEDMVSLKIGTFEPPKSAPTNNSTVNQVILVGDDDGDKPTNIGGFPGNGDILSWKHIPFEDCDLDEKISKILCVKKSWVIKATTSALYKDFGDKCCRTFDNTNGDEFLYVLKCQNSKWYVGRTSYLRQRYKSHCESSVELETATRALNYSKIDLECSQTTIQRLQDVVKRLSLKWTAVYAPIAISCVLPYTPYLEDAVTLKLMEEFGIDSVRGGKYTFVSLAESQISEIKKSIYHETGACFRCSKKGHYANTCTLKKESHKKGTQKDISFSKRNTTNNTASPIKRTEISNFKGNNQIKYLQKIKSPLRCERCQRNHLTENCYATTSLDGKLLLRTNRSQR